MSAGGCAVQILLLLLHGAKSSEDEIQKVAHLARDIDRLVLSGTHKDPANGKNGAGSGPSACGT